MSSRSSELQEKYEQLLQEYLLTHGEEILLELSKMARELLMQGIGPDEITAIHTEALNRICSGMSPEEAMEAMQWASNPLLELMVNYAMNYREQIKEKEKKIADMERRGALPEVERYAGIGIIATGVVSKVGGVLERILQYLKAQEGKGGNQVLKALHERMSQILRFLKLIPFLSHRISRTKAELVDPGALLMESLRIISSISGFDVNRVKANLEGTVKLKLNTGELQQAFLCLFADIMDKMDKNGYVEIGSNIRLIEGKEWLVMKITFPLSPSQRYTFSCPWETENVRLILARNTAHRLGGEIDVEKSNGKMAYIFRLPILDRLDEFLRGMGQQ